MWSNEIKQSDLGQSVWIQELFLHRLFFVDMNWKPLNSILVKRMFLFKSMSFNNGLSYWALLGLEWKIFCHNLLICFYFYIWYWCLAAMNMSRCPYICELDSNLFPNFQRGMLTQKDKKSFQSLVMLQPNASCDLPKIWYASPYM